jgi:hypothetical protein
LNFDLRIIFLFLLVVSVVLFVLRQGLRVLSFTEIGQIVLDFLLVPAIAGTALTFAFLLTRQDPMPLIREAAYQMSFKQLVSYADIPSGLEKNLAVKDIARIDTDGDEFREWVVFYQFDLQDGRSPIQAVVYDNDRGNPPVIFPYALRPPNRDYVSENGVSLELKDITTDQNGPKGTDLKEIMVWGANELSIFRFKENSETWDFPRDAPPRYQPLGFFRGSGGVSFDEETRYVTVVDRGEFERSQLVKRSIYKLNPATDTYWDQYYPPEDLDRKLAAPAISTIDFLSGAPDNILDTTFPEKIVLAFYAATCGGKGEALCRNYKTGWNPQDFLAPNNDAFNEFRNDNPLYFGLSSFNPPDISVRYLRYYPQLETDADLSAADTDGGRDVYTGEQAQLDVVDITFAIVDNLTLVSREETARYEMRYVDGRWKIFKRLPLDMPALGAPTQVPDNPQE